MPATKRSQPSMKPLMPTPSMAVKLIPNVMVMSLIGFKLQFWKVGNALYFVNMCKSIIFHRGFCYGIEVSRMFVLKPQCVQSNTAARGVVKRKLALVFINIPGKSIPRGSPTIKANTAIKSNFRQGIGFLVGVGLHGHTSGPCAITVENDNVAVFLAPNWS